ncbi:MAG: aspartate/glutamate racemase family protein [Lactobacillaceae bacterium]|jgi:aspartate racemase|nr:aspartate/glutamate racemase family protein [Lactobacillaceae bacterium]
MKNIGILGGMSLESTLLYCEQANKLINKKLGGLHSPKIVMYTVDFAEIEKLQYSGEWEKAGNVLREAAKSIEAGGADFVIMATNTMHKVAGKIVDGLKIPFIHIGSATAKALLKDKVKTVGLLGTKFTMEEDFYKKVIEEAGIKVVVPNAEDRKIVNSVIYDELCKGKVLESSAQEYQRIINTLKDSGAEAVILGCTEIGMLVKSASLPIYDTTLIHVETAVNEALS